MRILAFILMLALLVTAGCTSSSKAKLREQEAFLRGQQQAIATQQQAQQPAVWFRGPVRNPRVPWTEDLTLTRALAAADYRDAFNPRTIRVIRQGQAYPIDIKRLLRGLDDPPLEPGDLIEISH